MAFGEPIYICTYYGASPQDMIHLFACNAHPTDLSPEDLWRNPVGSIGTFSYLDNRNLDFTTDLVMANNNHNMLWGNIDAFRQHVNAIHEQYGSVQCLKRNVSATECTVEMDFAENCVVSTAEAPQSIYYDMEMLTSRCDLLLCQSCIAT